jgi:uncharacterized membrane protein
MEREPRFTRAVRIIVIVLAAIGMAVVIRRVTVLASGPSTGYAASLDAGFARHPALTLIHILPGFLFMILGPLQFWRGLRSRAPRVHRWIGRVFVALGLVIGVSALGLSFKTSIGGANETAATTLFAVLFLFALIKGFVHIRRREMALHREWMLRAFAIGLAVATVRPIVGAFFATSRLTHLTPQEFFGIAFWLGFTLQLIAAEAWIRYTSGLAASARR